MPSKLITFFDAETSFKVRDKGKKDPSPFDPDNFLVSLGWQDSIGSDRYFPIRHNEIERDLSADVLLAKQLAHTTLLVAHNVKFDLMWLLECGFTYTGKVWDTMLVEYVLARGQKLPLSLDECCNRRGIKGKFDEVQQYYDKGISSEAIPWNILEPYGRQDIQALKELFWDQVKEVGYGV